MSAQGGGSHWSTHAQAGSSLSGEAPCPSRSAAVVGAGSQRDHAAVWKQCVTNVVARVSSRSLTDEESPSCRRTKPH
jgi:hypothetical protein